MSANFSYFQALPFCILDLNNDPEGRTIADLDQYIAEQQVASITGGVLYANFYAYWDSDWVGSNYPVPYTLSELMKFFWKANNVFWGGANGTCPGPPYDVITNTGGTLTRARPRYTRIHMDSCEDYINRGDLMYAWMVGHPTVTDNGVPLGFGGCGPQHGYYGLGTWDSSFCGFDNGGAEVIPWSFSAFGHPVPSNFNGSEAELNYRFPVCVKSGDLYYPQMYVGTEYISCGSDKQTAFTSWAILINGWAESTCNVNPEPVTVTCDTYEYVADTYTPDFEVDDGIVKTISLFDIHRYTNCPSPCSSFGTIPMVDVSIESFGFNFYS